jgi:hypothetical protein
LERPQALGLGHVHRAKLAPPPIQGLLGNIMLATDIADVSHDFCVVQNANNLFFCKAFALHISSG